MPRNINGYDSQPPPYGTPTPSTAYGTIGSTPQPPSDQSNRTYTRSYGTGSVATETSSLWNGTAYSRRSSRWTSQILCGVVALLLTVVFAQNTGLWSTLIDDLSPSEKAAMRRSWELERKLWVVEKEQWGLEKATHRHEVVMWEGEREEHLAERDAFEREKVSWARQRQDNRETFERENEERQRQRQEQEQEWARQRKKKEDAFEKEREEWARQRVEEDRHRKEIEWRRQGAYWTEPWATGSQCSGYGTRSYSAHLLELPGDVNWLEACMDIPLKVNGRWIGKPFKCQRDDHNIWGTWFVNFGESQCVTYWDTLYNMGCSPGQMGMRRYEARLMNLRNGMGDDWDLMCRTTPANIGGIHFDFPTSCEDKNGRTGVWDVPDELC